MAVYGVRFRVITAEFLSLTLIQDMYHLCALDLNVNVN